MLINLPSPSPSPSKTRENINRLIDGAQKGTIRVEKDQRRTDINNIAFPPYFFDPLPPKT